MRTAARSQPRAWGLGATVLVIGLLVGCGSSDTPAADRAGGPPAGADERQGEQQGPAEAPGEPERGPAAPGGAVDKDGARGKAPARVPVPGRSVVYTGQMTVRVDDVAEAATDAGRLATTAGGFVAGDNRRAEGPRGSATLVLRVPGDRFHDTVTRVAELGRELERTLTVDDVTEAVVDLDSRIASQQASVDRVRALLARAERIEAVVAIERELSTREAELAALQAQKRGLANQVAYSTVTVELVGPKASVKREKEPELGFVSGLKGGWQAFRGTVTVLLTVLGALLPFLVAMAVPAAAVWLGLRRLRRGTPVTPGSAPDTGPGAEGVDDPTDPAPAGVGSGAGTAPGAASGPGGTTTGTGPERGAVSPRKPRGPARPPS